MPKEETEGDQLSAIKAKRVACLKEMNDARGIISGLVTPELSNASPIYGEAREWLDWTGRLPGDAPTRREVAALDTLLAWPAGTVLVLGGRKLVIEEVAA